MSRPPVPQILGNSDAQLTVGLLVAPGGVAVHLVQFSSSPVAGELRPK